MVSNSFLKNIVWVIDCRRGSTLNSIFTALGDEDSNLPLSIENTSRKSLIIIVSMICIKGLHLLSGLLVFFCLQHNLPHTERNCTLIVVKQPGKWTPRPSSFSPLLSFLVFTLFPRTSSAPFKSCRRSLASPYKEFRLGVQSSLVSFSMESAVY